MTDLHTHILSNIDDGAQTVDEGVKILRAQLKSGVHTVALTPHFYPTYMDRVGFIERRSRAYKRLVEAVKLNNLQIRLILGAEVAFSTNLLEIDLDALCYEGTGTILVELPWDYYPPYVREIFYQLQLKGYTPLIAHIERYPYFNNCYNKLKELVQSGAYAQVNAESIIYGGNSKKRVLSLISDGMAHVMASDTHSIISRPPRLAEAARVVEKKFGSETAQKLVNGLEMFN